MGGARIKPIQFEKAVKNSGGIKSLIAKKMGVSNFGLDRWLKNNPEFYKYIEEEQEKLLDIAESKIQNSVNMARPEGSMDDVKWYLSRKGKHRGYVERPETQVNMQLNQNTKVYRFVIDNGTNTRHTADTETTPSSELSE